MSADARLTEALKTVFPKLASSNPDAPATWARLLAPAFRKFEVWTSMQQAAFLAQAGHESAHFTRLVENLSYTAQRLCDIWPKRFPTLASAEPYAGNPEALANKVYADRLGNGGPSTGDGWKYRGRGLFQITGKRNYEILQHGNGLNLVLRPELLEEPEHAITSALQYWYAKDLNRFATGAASDFERMTRLINGGVHGLTERLRLFGALQVALS